MSEEKDTYIKAYVDNNEVSVTRYARPDVIKAITGYGTINENPLPGYTGKVDISSYSYGEHTVKIETYDKENRLLGKETRKFTKNQPKTKITAVCSTHSIRWK